MCIAKRGLHVLTDGDDENHISKGVLCLCLSEYAVCVSVPVSLSMSVSLRARSMRVTFGKVRRMLLAQVILALSRACVACIVSKGLPCGLVASRVLSPNGSWWHGSWWHGSWWHGSWCLVSNGSLVASRVLSPNGSSWVLPRVLYR